MAKKVVAGLRNEEHRNVAKVIKMERSKKTGAYTFKEEIIPVDMVQKALARK